MRSRLVCREDGRKGPNAQAHFVVDCGADVGADDVVLWGGLREGHQREPWGPRTGGRGKGYTGQEPRRQVPAWKKQGFVTRWPEEVFVAQVRRRIGARVASPDSLSYALLASVHPSA